MAAADFGPLIYSRIKEIELKGMGRCWRIASAQAVVPLQFSVLGNGFSVLLGRSPLSSSQRVHLRAIGPGPTGVRTVLLSSSMAPVPKGKHAKRRGKPGPPRAVLRAAAAASSADAASASPSTTGKRRAENDAIKASEEPDTELVFEDPYGDEFEEEEVPAVADDGAPAIVDPMVANDAVVFRPGKDRVADGEKLVCDESAYDVFHKCNVEWPSLSFDFVCMNSSGAYDNINPVAMDTYPLSVSLVLGTQAERANKNKLVCVRMSNMHRTSRSKKGKGIQPTREHDSDSESSDEEDEQDEDGDTRLSPDKNAILQSSDIRMDSTVNRVRVMPQRANIVAAWCESGRVALVDVEPALNTLNLDSKRRMSMPNSIPPSAVKPFYAVNDHRAEGFALDWSRAAPGRLLSGAVNGTIYLSELASAEGSAWTTNPSRFRGHTDSVEDVQWSPNEPNVFASCSADKSIKFWDTREYRKPALGIEKAHNTDVNVISWNRNETHLVVSGGDDGIIRVWDLRTLDRQGSNESAKPAAEFVQHQQAITSIQWHPKDSSMLCASSEDGTVSIWDLAVERDAEEELREGVVLTGAEDFPPQLLFIHMGQKNVKDAQWHPACPSLVVSTAQDGLNMFQPSNITLPA